MATHTILDAASTRDAGTKQPATAQQTKTPSKTFRREELTSHLQGCEAPRYVSLTRIESEFPFALSDRSATNSWTACDGIVPFVCLGDATQRPADGFGGQRRTSLDRPRPTNRAPARTDWHRKSTPSVSATFTPLPQKDQVTHSDGRIEDP